MLPRLWIVIAVRIARDKGQVFPFASYLEIFLDADGRPLEKPPRRQADRAAAVDGVDGGLDRSEGVGAENEARHRLLRAAPGDFIPGIETRSTVVCGEVEVLFGVDKGLGDGSGHPRPKDEKKEKENSWKSAHESTGQTDKRTLYFNGIS